MRNARSYSVQAQAATYDGTKDTIIQIVPGAVTPLWIDYISCEGQSDVADAMEVLACRVSALSSGMTSYTPRPMAEGGGTEQIANAVGGAALTAVYLSTETDGTKGDILYRWSVSTQAGGGLQIWFPEGLVLFGAGVTTGFGLWINNAITSTTITATVNFSELG